MRISDWSSDVCPSDLLAGVKRNLHGKLSLPVCRVGDAASRPDLADLRGNHRVLRGRHSQCAVEDDLLGLVAEGRSVRAEIGRASCRERVCQYVKIKVVAVTLKIKYH